MARLVNGVFEMTEREYHELEDEMIGLCRSCGAERACCEPDARNYKCDECGLNDVFGVPELLVMGEVELVDDEECPDDCGEDEAPM